MIMKFNSIFAKKRWDYPQIKRGQLLWEADR